MITKQLILNQIEKIREDMISQFDNAIELLKDDKEADFVKGRWYYLNGCYAKYDKAANNFGFLYKGVTSNTIDMKTFKIWQPVTDFTELTELLKAEVIKRIGKGKPIGVRDVEAREMSKFSGDYKKDYANLLGEMTDYNPDTDTLYATGYGITIVYENRVFATVANDMQAKLEEAKLKYPIGTEFIMVNKIEKYKVVKGIRIGEVYYNYLYAIDSDGSSYGVIYDGDTDTWAEIIPQDKGAVLIEEAKKMPFYSKSCTIKLCSKIYKLEANIGEFLFTGTILFYQGAPIYNCNEWATIIQEPIIIDGKEVVIRGTMVGISDLVFSRRQIETFQSLNPIFTEILNRMEEKNGGKE